MDEERRAAIVKLLLGHMQPIGETMMSAKGAEFIDRIVKKGRRSTNIEDRRGEGKDESRFGD